MKIKNKRVVGTVRPKEFPEIVRPSFTDSLVFPNNLSDLVAENITDLMGKYALLESYARQELSKVKQKLLKKAHLLFEEKNTIYLKEPAINSLSRDQKEQKYGSYPSIQRLKAEITLLEVEETHIETVADNFKRLWDTLSRDLSRRSFTERN